MYGIHQMTGFADDMAVIARNENEVKGTKIYIGTGRRWIKIYLN